MNEKTLSGKWHIETDLVAVFAALPEFLIFWFATLGLPTALILLLKKKKWYLVSTSYVCQMCINHCHERKVMFLKIRFQLSVKTSCYRLAVSCRDRVHAVSKHSDWMSRDLTHYNWFKGIRNLCTEIFCCIKVKWNLLYVGLKAYKGVRSCVQCLLWSM